MAETVNVLGRPVNKKVVIYGGAAAAGFVGYAWWTSRGMGASDVAPTDEELPLPVEEPQDDPGFTVGGGTALVTNSDWYMLVLDRLQLSGLEAGAISSAIGKFLARQPLNTAEQAIAQQALAAAGQPPQGGPWYIIPVTSGGSGPTPSKPLPGKPVGIRTSTNDRDVTILWAPTPGAKAYGVEIIAGAGVGRKVIDSRLVPSPSYRYAASGRTLEAGKPYRYYIAAINHDNKPGSKATGTFTTKRSTRR